VVGKVKGLFPMEWAGRDSNTAAEPSYARTYYRWARFYDLFFDWPFHPGRLAAARAVAQAAGNNGEVLVAGVGTGLELALMPDNLRILGIDLARPMLDIARERVKRKGLDQVKALRVMDAQALEFQEGRFDVVLAPYLLSVAPSPQQVLEEMWRVTRPGGEMIILNHFSAEDGWRVRAEKALIGAGGWLGWRPYFPYAVMTDWLASRPEAQLLERREVAPARLFTVLRIRKPA